MIEGNGKFGKLGPPTCLPLGKLGSEVLLRTSIHVEKGLAEEIPNICSYFKKLLKWSCQTSEQEIPNVDMGFETAFLCTSVVVPCDCGLETDATLQSE
ncbi:hypothetical protein Y1Q_0015103 [Alligator mississippiensis]|uniref:Uncharacterized protein n=1 Tax=Alligator mississippiensis TaxID=8496 RepID=A0A151P8M5_ALLMI|nr:hypothetical protein Y1Q_0015103 [Alligator mississippiensis]